MELTRYFPKEMLGLCWEISPQIIVERGTNTTIHDVKVEANGPLARQLLGETSLPASEIAPNALAYRSLGLLMRQGPVIIRPNPLLCQALHDTEIRVSTTDFKMPFPLMAIELPPEIVGRHYPSLTVVWRLFPDSIMIWTLSTTTHVMYHCLIGNDTPTIEDRLIKAEGCDDEEEYNLMVVGGRIAANLCMLASHRQTTIDPLPKKHQRHRNRDERLQMLAARHFREIVFRDLILQDRGGSVSGKSAYGRSLAPQHRRGHWRRVPHGPRVEQLRRWTWISDYQTGEGDSQPSTIIMK